MTDAQRNVFGEPLELCSAEPLTGFTRSGCCDRHEADPGQHTVCALVTAEFLDYSRRRGNDLATPQPDMGFPGLRPGDRWCLCAARWLEAYKAGHAPRIILTATHEGALDIIPLDALKAHALDLS